MPIKTKDWQLYEAGKKYNNKLKPNYYEQVDANIAFYQGDQWRNLEGENLPKPTFNIIKRVISFFVASLTSSKTKIHFEPLTHSEIEDNPINPSNIANVQVSNLFEKFKMDFKIKDALFDAAITADSCAHFYFDMSKKPYGNAFKDIKGEIEMELVDGTNVFFGNANNQRVDIQPYIIISGRDTVDNLKDEAKRFKQQQQEIDGIQSDKNFNEQAGDSSKIEVESDDYGKALYIIVYRKDKKTGTIKASKSVENAYIYKDIDTELTQYPVAWLNWEKQKGQYHGRALSTGILPNQIFINRMFAMVMYHLMMTAFPKPVYNRDVIDVWDNEIGTAIGVSGMGTDFNVRNMAGYLEPGQMSGQIISTIDMAMSYTKECLGISDASIGNVDPKNSSPSSVIAIQKAASIPLENPKANLYEWIEDIGKILFDMMGTYYGLRPVIMEIEGKKQAIQFDFSQFKNLWFNIRADVGESSYWSEVASIQTLDNLLAQGHIDLIAYLERVPDEYIPQKDELISQIKQNMQNQQPKQDIPSLSISFKDLPPSGQAQMAQLAGIQIDPQELQMIQQQQAPQQHPIDEILSQLPKHQQEQFMKMSPEEQNQFMQQMMSEQPPNQ